MYEIAGDTTNHQKFIKIQQLNSKIGQVYLDVDQYICISPNNFKTKMNQINRKWERLSNEEKNKAKEELILFFENERDEKIGIIAAEEILNFFLQSVGSKLYNKGVEDAKKALENRFEELKYDLNDLLDL